jgi:peptidoglycan hydrolase-like protein with peptidoglycan-binding domain
MKKNKLIWLSIAAVFTGVTAFLIYDLKKKAKQNQNNDCIVDGVDMCSDDVPGDSYLFPLGVGSKGEKVIALQKYLNAKTNAKLSVDGIFGPLTLKALLNQQSKENYTEEKGKVSESYYDQFVKSFE